VRSRLSFLLQDRERHSSKKSRKRDRREEREEDEEEEEQEEEGKEQEADEPAKPAKKTAKRKSTSGGPALNIRPPKTTPTKQGASSKAFPGETWPTTQAQLSANSMDVSQNTCLCGIKAYV